MDSVPTSLVKIHSLKVHKQYNGRAGRLQEVKAADPERLGLFRIVLENDETILVSRENVKFSDNKIDLVFVTQKKMFHYRRKQFNSNLEPAISCKILSKFMTEKTGEAREYRLYPKLTGLMMTISWITNNMNEKATALVFPNMTLVDDYYFAKNEFEVMTTDEILYVEIIMRILMKITGYEKAETMGEDELLETLRRIDCTLQVYLNAPNVSLNDILKKLDKLNWVSLNFESCLYTDLNEYIYPEISQCLEVSEDLSEDDGLKFDNESCEMLE